MRKILIFSLFISTLVQANDYSFDVTSARFTLRIDKMKIAYYSNNFQKIYQLQPCHQKLASDLNTELFKLLSFSQVAGGLPFRLNGKKYEIGPKSGLGNMLVNMDSRMMRFHLEQDRACKAKG